MEKVNGEQGQRGRRDIHILGHDLTAGSTFKIRFFLGAYLRSCFSNAELARLIC